jgi:hypothetical protein
MTPELKCVIATLNVPSESLDGVVELSNLDRSHLATLFGTLGYKQGAEIGVETGRFSQCLLEKNPFIQKLYLVDAWKKYGNYREHVPQQQVDGLLAHAKQRLQPWSTITRFVRMFSLEAAPKFKDGSLDFVYIDANHSLPHVLDDICAWAPKVRQGGIVAGHDFRRNRRVGEKQCHVVEAVTCYTSAFGIRPYFVLGSKDPQEGEFRDKNRSFFWVVD